LLFDFNGIIVVRRSIVGLVVLNHDQNLELSQKTAISEDKKTKSA